MSKIKTPTQPELNFDKSVVLYPISLIKIPPERQRADAVPDANFIESIRTNGLLQPIVIHEDGTLVAGERRYNAHVALGLELIRATILENLPPVKAFEIELIENIARKQLRWQEEYGAIYNYHNLRCDAFPGWTQLGTAEALSISPTQVSNAVLLGPELSTPEVSGSATMTGALNYITSKAERALNVAVARGLIAQPKHIPPVIEGETREERTANLLKHSTMVDIMGAAVEEIDPRAATINAGREAAELLSAQKAEEPVHKHDVIHCADFNEWAYNYSGPKFDVIHCDFPYGKGYSGSNTRKSAETCLPTYVDTEEVFFQLLDTFLQTYSNYMQRSAHCIFWFDMLHYTAVCETFAASSWKLVQPYPLIWSKNYTGVASDPARRPRHTYETALLFALGDRKLVKLDKDNIECPLDDKLHINQKPQVMLKHFLGMLVDEHTAVLDPTCGSGSSLVAARSLGASNLVGLELDESNADIAKFFFAQ